MNKRTAFISAWLLGNLGFQVALLCSIYTINGFGAVLEELVTSQLYMVYLMQLLFIGMGCFITFRHGTNEMWIKVLIGYSIGFITTQVVFGVLSILFHIHLSNGVAALVPYTAGIIFAVLMTIVVKERLTMLRYRFFGLAGAFTILAYDAIIKFWSNEWASMLQFIVFIPILYAWMPFKKGTKDVKDINDAKKDA